MAIMRNVKYIILILQCISKFSGIKKYVNDCIKYKAAAEYGITKIIYDDTVDPWDGYGWNVPADYIPNIEYNKEHNDPILPAGLRTTADELISESYCALYMIVEEWKAQGASDETIGGMIFTVAWKNLGGGNYQLYIMWNGNYVNSKIDEYLELGHDVNEKDFDDNFWKWLMNNR